MNAILVPSRYAIAVSIPSKAILKKPGFSQNDKTPNNQITRVFRYYFLGLRGSAIAFYIWKFWCSITTNSR
ncbi:hypothetical protein [Brunnivagina elsteri]|uniref:hypothetical protein n=1 Tax=Brunnivagina elsteri TaxID=1247191 RepID=UPI001B80B131|nr:hypothetical protein [Calothrix elsteri]